MKAKREVTKKTEFKVEYSEGDIRDIIKAHAISEMEKEDAALAQFFSSEDVDTYTNFLCSYDGTFEGATITFEKTERLRGEQS